MARPNHLYESDCQKHRHRVIAAGLYFQRGSDTFVQTALTEQGEHGGRVSGSHDGTDQQPLQQIQVEQPGGDITRQSGCNQNAHSGKRQGWPQSNAERGSTRAHAAVQKNDCQSEVAGQIGQRVVVKLNAAYPVFPGQHPDSQKEDQDGNAKT